MLTILTIIAFIGIIYGIISKVQTSLNEAHMKKGPDRYGDMPTPQPVLPYGKSVLRLSVIAFIIFLSVGMTLYRIGAQEVGVVVTPRGVSEEELTTMRSEFRPFYQEVVNDMVKNHMKNIHKFIGI